MLKRSSKALFYNFASPLMRINGHFYMYFLSPQRGVTKVHLGPGQFNYINNWINLDANIFTGKTDVWVDLKYALPFRNNSVDALYSHHVIEHLPNLDFHFTEAFRILKPGGVYRLGGPNGDNAILKFQQNDINWFDDWPDNRTSIGGRFENFIFCRGEHLTILTESFLTELLTKIGFSNFLICKPIFETNYFDIYKDCLKYEFESNLDFPHTLILEAQKPLITSS